jgi:hypothetical protein
MSNEEHSKQNEIKRNNTFHKNPNKIPELQVKVGNSQMNYSDFKINDNKKSKSSKTNYPISRKDFLNNDNKLNLNYRNTEHIINQKISSEDFLISDNEAYSPRRAKKSNLKRASTSVSQYIEQKKSVKFAGNSNEEPLQTIIFIPNEIEENEEKNEKANCNCACFVF